MCHRQSVGHLRWREALGETHSPECGPPPMARAVPKYGVISVMGGVISQANQWEDYSSYLGEGMRISRNCATTHFWPFMASELMGELFGCVVQLMYYNEWVMRLQVYWKSSLPLSWAQLFFCYIFSFGCIRSQLWHKGTLLYHMGYFFTEQTLQLQHVSFCGCSLWALQWHGGLVALQHVGSQFPNQGSNQCPLHYKADF